MLCFIIIIQGIGHRLSLAFSTIPNSFHWLQTVELLLIYGLISLPIGSGSGFLKVDIVRSRTVIIAVILYSLFSPAITEELFFRVLLLPHPTENVSAVTLWLWGCGSLAIFIVYHPLNALTFFPAGRKTFVNLVFLLLAGFLGGICGIAYQQTGSLWPPVVIPWLTVTIWLLLFSGYRKLYH